MSTKSAIVTGITGQDGSLLARLLLEKGYTVHGLVRRSSAPNVHRIEALLREGQAGGSLEVHFGDLTDFGSIFGLVGRVRPDEIYNLAAQSHVAVSFDTPEYTANADGVGALRFLEAIRHHGLDKCRFYQASTSELYGKVQETPQRETTPFYPRSPYGVAKLYAYWITVNYREAYGTHASNGILFNHEGVFRGELFVTRKITKGVARISLGHKEPIYLGNLDALRDWGDAADYVRGMYLIVQQDEPGDYVLATGEMHSVREFVEESFRCVGREIEWSGTGVSEVGRDSQTGDVLVCVDERFFRPAEVDLLAGDPTKAREKLGWKHEKTFHAMVRDMVDRDVHRQRRAHESGMTLEDFV